MKLLGYCNAWSARPGDSLEFMVSSEEGEFDVAMVRLFQVDERPCAPPYREQVVAADCAGRYPGRKKRLVTGSYLRIANHELLESTSFTLTAWIYPTTAGRGRQGLFGKGVCAGGSGYELLISEAGRLRLALGRPSGGALVLEGTQRLEKAWYFIAAGYDSSSGRTFIWQKRRSEIAPHLRAADVADSASAAGEAMPSNRADLLLGALHAADSAEVTSCFNGKIGGPAVYHRALSPAEITALYESRSIDCAGLAARWDLAAHPFGTSIPDRSRNGLDARAVNHPMRAVTGARWDGSAAHFLMNPAHYDAIYLHEDDLEDAGWPVDFTWRLPADIPSGVYAARLRSATAEDYVPFVVRAGSPSEGILLVLPTFTYQAYANERYHKAVDWTQTSDQALRLSPQDRFSAETPGLGCSIYDAHTDGSFNCYSSQLRPVVNFRPKSTSYWNGAGRHFGADMYLVDWLDRYGFAHDVAIDHDLHADGLGLLSPYQVVILGSHPEYFSWPMRRALEDYVARGGNLMYLGGNGCWWVTDVDPERPHVIEVRKKFIVLNIPGIGVEPGEEFLGASGRRGGFWRESGRPPESLFGVGFTAHGFCRASGYKRRPDSFKPEVRFIFDGIGEDEVIGDFGLAFGGAAGDEFDRAFPGGGTPPNTYILASSFDHPKDSCSSLCAIPEQPPEVQAASLRSDLTYYVAPGGGRVFAAGSMCWCTSLPHNRYDNSVSRITRNVLIRFLGGRE